MERLTKRLEDGQAIFHECHGTCGTCDGANCYCIGPMVDRLAAYEDTGLDPEQVIELKSFTKGGIHKVDDGWKPVQDLLQAEQTGRLVVLPCKVGDTVWVVFSNGLRPYVVDRLYVMADIKVMVRMRHMLTETLRISGDEFGKTVFLTREEAEAALKGGESDA